MNDEIPGEPAPASDSGLPVAERQGPINWIAEMRGLLLMLAAVVGFHSFIAKPFYIPSPSMVPNLLVGDRLVVSKYPYGWSWVSASFHVLPRSHSRLFPGTPEYGDIVIVVPPFSDEDYIKKIALNSLYRPSDETIHHALQTFHLNRETYIQTARATQGINYLMMLTLTTVPIQIISSSHDYVTPYLYNAYVTQWWARKAKLTLLNQTGHLSNIQKPAQFNSIVKAFIEKC